MRFDRLAPKCGEPTNLEETRYCNGTNRYVKALAIKNEEWLKEKIQVFLDKEKSVVKVKK